MAQEYPDRRLGFMPESERGVRYIRYEVTEALLSALKNDAPLPGGIEMYFYNEKPPEVIAAEKRITAFIKSYIESLTSASPNKDIDNH